MAVNNHHALSERIAIVTGGGGGIGKVISLALATDGARVVICDIDEAAAKSSLKSIPDSAKHVAKAVDVSDLSSVQELFSQIEKEVGTPSILVNCAGIKAGGPIVELSDENFDKVIAVNLKGSFLMTQAISKLMIRDKISDGSIINISSVAGPQGFETQSAYSSSKAGVEALTKTTARELGKYGIRCNSIRPGVIETPLIEDLPQDILETLKSMTPLGRYGKPEEVAEVAKFLASSKSSFITGAVIQVSGGLFM